MPGGRPKGGGVPYSGSMFHGLRNLDIDYDEARMAWRLQQSGDMIRAIAIDYVRMVKAGLEPSDCEVDAWKEAQRRGMKVGSGRPKRLAGVETVTCERHKSRQARECDECDFLRAGQESPMTDEPTNSITSPIEAIKDEPEELLGARFDLIDQLDHPMIAH